MAVRSLYAQRMRVLSVVGNRPQFIKSGPLSLALSMMLLGGIGSRLRVKEPVFAATLLFVIVFAALAEALGLHFVVGAFFGSVLLSHELLGPQQFEQARKTGVPVPAPHSPEWAPDLERTLKAAVRAEVTQLLELFGGK